MKTEEAIITPDQYSTFADFLELWKYREFIYILVWRDVKVRYKQTLLGIVWVIFQPLVSTGIFSIFFGKLAKIPSGELPYTLFVFLGLLYWSYFSNTLGRISQVMVDEQDFIKKIYFPRIILPFIAIAANSVDFFINFIVLFILAAIYGFWPNLLSIVIFPVIYLITVLTALGLGLILSSLNVKYRDVRYVLPFFIQILLFLTPVIYPLAIVGERNKYLMAINPMTSVIELARFTFANPKNINPQMFTVFAISLISTLLILYVGFRYFRRTERFFADIV